MLAYGFEDLMYYTVPMSDFFAANLIRGCFRMQVMQIIFIMPLVMHVS